MTTKKKTNINDNRAYITQRVNQLSNMGAKDEEIKAVLRTNTLSAEKMDTTTVRKIANKLKTKTYSSKDLSVNPETGGIYRKSTLQKLQLFRQMDTIIKGDERVDGIAIGINWASEQRSKFSKMNETQVLKMKTANAKNKKNQYISALESRYKIMKKLDATPEQLKNARAAIRSVKLLSPTKFIDSLKDPLTSTQWKLLNRYEQFYGFKGKEIQTSDTLIVSEIAAFFDNIYRASKIAYSRSAQHK